MRTAAAWVLAAGAAAVVLAAAAGAAPQKALSRAEARTLRDAALRRAQVRLGSPTGVAELSLDQRHHEDVRLRTGRGRGRPREVRRRQP